MASHAAQNTSLRSTGKVALSNVMFHQPHSKHPDTAILRYNNGSSLQIIGRPDPQVECPISFSLQFDATHDPNPPATFSIQLGHQIAKLMGGCDSKHIFLVSVWFSEEKGLAEAREAVQVPRIKIEEEEMSSLPATLPYQRFTQTQRPTQPGAPQTQSHDADASWHVDHND